MKLEKFRAWAAPRVISAGSPPSLSLSQKDENTFHLRHFSFLGCIKDGKVQKMDLNALQGRMMLQQAGWDMVVINLGQPKE